LFQRERFRVLLFIPT